jgi:hypothetical protein
MLEGGRPHTGRRWRSGTACKQAERRAFLCRLAPEGQGTSYPPPCTVTTMAP